MVPIATARNSGRVERQVILSSTWHSGAEVEGMGSATGVHFTSLHDTFYCLASRVFLSPTHSLCPR
ncbi:hypothetical protein BDP81DRAFT_414759 [Colletotrichum phormii]|uniref:Uncharacterized protein n=1 Tax=Colletotrichum phormii TaxID=359342 RepID=A0AAJ0EMA3_9PEZI|nr:uncharacterized protein BDP81DRAFT_414759 [Colletotrichum phormii]KAK1656387.1 hypothetical protein BDP81DRAFT_414759 [Colletotrichum phormii]